MGGGSTQLQRALALRPGAQNIADFTSVLYYAGGTVYPSAPSLVDDVPTGQPTSSGLLVEGEATNLLKQSQCDQHVGGSGTTPPSVATQTVFDGVSCTRATFTPSGDLGFFGTRIAQDGHTAAFTAIETTYSLYVGLSRELTGSEALSYYWTGSDASPQVEITAANSAKFVGTLVRLSVTKTHAGAGAIYPVVYLKQTLTSDVDVYVARGQAEVGARATSWIETTTAPVTRAAAAPTLVQGAGSLPFLGATNGDEVTAAITWNAVPDGTATERMLWTLQREADHSVNDNNRIALFYGTDNILYLGVQDTVWRGGVDVGSGSDDGGQHTAIVYANRLTGDISLSIDGATAVTANKAGQMPTALERTLLMHSNNGTPFRHSGGLLEQITSANGVLSW